MAKSKTQVRPVPWWPDSVRAEHSSCGYAGPMRSLNDRNSPPWLAQLDAREHSCRQYRDIPHAWDGDRCVSS